MATPSVTYAFANNTFADADQVDQNFTDLVTFCEGVIQADGSIPFTAHQSTASADPTSGLHLVNKQYADGESMISSTPVSQTFTLNVTGVLKFGTPDEDTASAYNTTTGLYTCARAGLFLLTYVIKPTANDSNVYRMLVEHGATTLQGPRYNPSFVVGSTDPCYGSFTTLINCNAGDTIGPFIQSSATVTRSLGERLCITRLHG